MPPSTINNTYNFAFGVNSASTSSSGTLPDVSPGVTVTGISTDGITFVPVTVTDNSFATSAEVDGQYLILKANTDGTDNELVTPDGQALVNDIAANQTAATPLTDTFYVQLSNGNVDEVAYTLNDVLFNANGSAYGAQPLSVAPSTGSLIAGLSVDKALPSGQTSDQSETLTVTVSVFDYNTQQSDGSLSIDALQTAPGAGGTITTVTTGQVHSVTMTGSIAQINADLAGLTYNSPSTTGDDHIQIQAVDGPATTATELEGEVITSSTVAVATTYEVSLPVSTVSSNIVDTGLGETLTGISTDGIDFIPVSTTDPTFASSAMVDGQYISASANADSTMQFGLVQGAQTVVDDIQANQDSGATTPLSDTFYLEVSNAGATSIDTITVDLEDVEFSRTAAPFTSPITVNPGTFTNIAGLVVDKALADGQSTDQGETLTVTIAAEDFDTGQSDGSLSIDPTAEGAGAGGTITTDNISSIHAITITGSIAEINADLQGLSYTSSQLGTDTLLVSAIDGPAEIIDDELGAINIAAPINNVFNYEYYVSSGLVGYGGTLGDLGSGQTLTGISTDDIHFTPVTTTDPSFSTSASLTGQYLVLEANADGTDEANVYPDSQTLIDDIAASTTSGIPVSDTFYYQYTTAGTSLVDQVNWNLDDVEVQSSGAAYTQTGTGIGPNSSINIGGLTVDKALATGQTSDTGDVLTFTVGMLDFSANPQNVDGALSLNSAAEGSGAGGIINASTISLGVTTDAISAITITGSIAEIDADLEGLTYSSSATAGTDTLYWQAVDGPTDVQGFILGNVHSPCYCRGTRILTEAGEVAVEELVIGDRLVTHSGAARPLRWIGRRSYSRRFAAANPDVRPVLIRAGAIGDAVPARDLYVSPRHAMHFENMLIPAAALVNGVTILRPPAGETVEYFHLELESHDILIAEGAEAESYLDEDNRNMFHNAAEYAHLHPSAPPRACAPRIEVGDAVDQVRARLAARAVLAGYRAPRTQFVCLEAAGQCRISVPPGVSQVHLLSTAGHAPGDRRSLGALVLGLRLDGMPIALSDARLLRGFHPSEQHGSHAVRWTNGEAVIALAPVTSEQSLEVQIGALLPMSAVA